MAGRGCPRRAADYVFAGWQVVVGLTVLRAVIGAPWEAGLIAALLVVAVWGAICLGVYRVVVGKVIDPLLFDGGRQPHCLDLWEWARVRVLQQPGRPFDAEWAAVPRVRGAVYEEYLDSDVWRRRRALKLEEVGYRCEQCGGTRTLQAHHLTYKRLGNERRSDLRILCCTCHSDVHNKDLCRYSGGW